MKFSERYGYGPVSPNANWEAMTPRLRNRLWNVVYNMLERRHRRLTDGCHLVQAASSEAVSILKDFLAIAIDQVTRKGKHGETYCPLDLTLSHIKTEFHGNLQWFQVYEMIEFLCVELSKALVPTFDLEKEVNRALAEESAPYRLIEGEVAPLTDSEEIRELTKALKIAGDRLKPVREHLRTALERLSDRPKPDARNSIKESISAVESIVQVVLGKEGTLSKLIKSLNIHSQLAEGWSNLYHWTCDDPGIRHGKTGLPLNANVEEARYMLVAASAFVNYVATKQGDIDHGKHTTDSSK